MDEITIVVNAEDNFSGVLGNFGNIMTGIKSTIDLVSDAIQGAADFIGDFVASAADSEIAIAKLNIVLESTGNQAGFTSEQLQDMATGLMNVTGNSDEAEMAAETMLLRFENLNGIFPEALGLANDLSAALGIDLTTAAQTVGKALDDPEQGIGRLNTQFKLFNDTEMETIKNMAANGDVAGAQALIMERLTEKIGGTAEALGDTFQGRLNIASEKFDNLKEVIGGAFLPVLSDLMTRISDFMSRPEVQAFIQEFAEKLSVGLQAVTFYFDLFMANLGQIGDIIASGDISQLGDIFLDMVNSVDWNGISNKIADSISGIDWGRIGNVIAQGLGYLAIAIGTVLSEIDWGALLNSSINALLDLIGGLFGFIDWDDMWNSAVAGFNWIGEQIKNWISGIGDSVGNWFTDMSDKIGQAIGFAIQYAINYANMKIQEFSYIGKQIVDGLVDGLNAATGGMLFAIGDMVYKLIYKVKSILGIASPSSLFYDIAHDIVYGLIGGFNAFWDDLVDLAQTKLDDFLQIFGIDISLGGGTLGGGVATHTGPGGGTTGGGTGTGAGSGTVNNYYYGPVYFQGGTEPGSYYDCPSPNPLMTAGSGTVVTNGAQ